MGLNKQILVVSITLTGYIFCCNQFPIGSFFVSEIIQPGHHTIFKTAQVVGIQHTHKDSASIKPHRSAWTMYYVNYATNLSLSKMADHKAHILIGLNLFLLSFFVTKKHLGVLARVDGYIIPNILLITSCLASIVLCLLVARPILSSRKMAQEQTNWFFFDSFKHHTVEEFHQAIFDLQHDQHAVHEAMSRDLYWMGLSLSRKYRLLTMAYRVFIYCQLTTALVYFAFFAWNHLQR